MSPGSQRPAPSSTHRTVRRALDDLLDWVVANGPAGSDPYDALSSPLARLAAPFGRYGRIAFLQAVRRAPVDLRRPLGIRPAINAKGVAVLAHAHLEVLEHRDDPRHRELARERLDWLEHHAAPFGAGVGWGYPFDWAARAFFIPRGTPSIVVSSVAGQAFLRSAAILGRTGDLAIAQRVGSFVASELHRHECAEGICFSYTPIDRSRVLNASLMGTALLARLAEHRPGSEEQTVRRATDFVLHHQNPDGSWPYGLARHHRWVDGHHTGFILRDLAAIADSTGREDLAPAIERGLAFYLDRLIAPDGRPLFRLDRPWPADIHACAEAILVLTDPALAGRAPHMLDRAIDVARWTMAELGRGDGAYGYRRHTGRVDWTPHLRWGQAWMLWALARLERSLAAREPGLGVQ